MKTLLSLLSSISFLVVWTACHGAERASATVAADSRGTGSQHTELTACARDLDCQVIPETRCGRCGAADHGDARAVSRRAFSTALAAGTMPFRDGPDCPNGACSCNDCASTTPSWIFADCHQGGCRLTEADRTPFTECATDADCTLAKSACGTCQGDWVAIARTQEEAFAAYLCEGDALEPPCTPSPPPAVPLACDAGRCRLR